MTENQFLLLAYPRKEFVKRYKTVQIEVSLPYQLVIAINNL